MRVYLLTILPLITSACNEHTTTDDNTWQLTSVVGTPLCTFSVDLLPKPDTIASTLLGLEDDVPLETKLIFLDNGHFRILKNDKLALTGIVHIKNEILTLHAGSDHHEFKIVTKTAMKLVIVGEARPDFRSVTLIFNRVPRE